MKKYRQKTKKMKNQNVSYILCSTIVLVCFLSSSKVDAWGGLFNRFNPSMLSDLGYGNGGGGYGKELYSAAHSGVSIMYSEWYKNVKNMNIAHLHIMGSNMFCSCFSARIK